MEHSGETKLLSSKPESNSSQLEDAAGPQQELPEGEHVSNLGYNALSYYQLKTAAEREARIYMASKPMNDSGAKNVALHGSIIRLFNGISEQPTYDDLIIMREAIDYRMSQVMGAATTYKNFWDLDMPDCHKFDVEANFFGRNIIDAFDWVCGYALFDEPDGFQGHPYVKGYKYVACCIAKAGWDLAKAEAKLDTLVQHKAAGVFRTGIPNVEGASRIRSMLRRITLSYEGVIREELEKISHCMDLRIRSVSLSKPHQTGIPVDSVEGR